MSDTPETAPEQQVMAAVLAPDWADVVEAARQYVAAARAFASAPCSGPNAGAAARNLDGRRAVLRATLAGLEAAVARLDGEGTDDR